MGIAPGRWSSPTRSSSDEGLANLSCGPLTAINFLLHSAFDGALVRLCHTLRLQVVAHQCRRVHRPLKRVVFPPEQVVAVRSVAPAVVEAPHKRLGTISRPDRLIVELRRVPHCLIGNLRHANWMRRWAGASVLERSLDSVVHVVLVVGTYNIGLVSCSRKG